jgi:hypothetical protein
MISSTRTAPEAKKFNAIAVRQLITGVWGSGDTGSSGDTGATLASRLICGLAVNPLRRSRQRRRIRCFRCRKGNDRAHEGLQWQRLSGPWPRGGIDFKRGCSYGWDRRASFAVRRAAGSEVSGVRRPSGASLPSHRSRGSSRTAFPDRCRARKFRDLSLLAAR